MVTINIAFHSNPRGPGYWKLNTSFLTEKDYATQIRTVITQVHEGELISLRFLLKKPIIWCPLHVVMMFEMCTDPMVFLLLDTFQSKPIPIFHHEECICGSVDYVCEKHAGPGIYLH